jgi:acetyl esterase/lipase
MGVEDALAAIRFLRANATQYCINPDKIGVTGFSAGGYYTAIVAALSGVNGHEFDNADLGNAGVSSKVQAAVGWSGLTDFARLDQINDVSGALQHCGISSPEGQLLGCDPCAASCANSPKSNPLNYITAENCADLPPIMMEHGKKDNLVPWKSAEIFVDKINQTCGAGRAVGNYYENGNHGTGLGNATVIFTNFLDVHLK